MDYEKEIPFGAFDSELMHQEINIPEGFEAEIKGNKIILKKTESEDEKVRKELITHCRNTRCVTEEGAEKIAKWIAFLEKQGEQKPLKVYRVENEAEEKGLWRKFDGTWQPLFDMLPDGKCKDMPMEDNPIYREGGKRWFTSAPSKKALQEWFSKRDLEELVSKGFTITEFEVAEYKKVSDFEYIFTRDNIINKCYLEVSDIYPEQKPAWNEEVQERQVSAEFINALGTMLNDGLPDRYLVSEERIKKSAELLFSIARKQLKNEKQEWSEEDESLRLRTIGALETCKIGSPTKCVDEQINWLKSLKQRIKGE